MIFCLTYASHVRAKKTGRTKHEHATFIPGNKPVVLAQGSGPKALRSLSLEPIVRKPGNGSETMGPLNLKL